MTGKEFSGRTALITGAASGIGAACARWLDQHGIAELVLVDLDQAGLDTLELSCRTQRIAGDVSDPALWEDIETRLSQLDHAFINAGIADGAPLSAQDFAQWKQIMAVNLDGVFLALRASLRVMERNGGKSIVLTSSIAGVKPLPGTAAYGASKAAVAHLARIAAAEYAQAGIRINAIAPGKVETPIWTKTSHFQHLVEQLGSREAAMQALHDEVANERQSATADEIAGQIGFLLSDAATNITGVVLSSDGGWSL